MNKKIGKISKKVIDILNLKDIEDRSIFIGESNIIHIQNQHPQDFIKYGKYIKDIIKEPSYLARNEKKQSIEFIKEFKTDNDFVLVVVRISGKGNYFVRTMYVMSDEKVEKYAKHNYFKPYTI